MLENVRTYAKRIFYMLVNKKSSFDCAKSKIALVQNQSCVLQKLLGCSLIFKYFREKNVNLR